MNLPIELKGIVTAGLPALQQVRLPTIQDTGHLVTLGDLGKCTVVQVAADGLAAHTHLLCDLPNTHACLMQAHDLCVAIQPARPPVLALQLA